MFIKYQMAMFLGIFGATMLVQFIVQFLKVSLILIKSLENVIHQYSWDIKWSYFS